ncbi:hypothetical protein IQ255_20215 [Pleurocapsales cyanobacterium LEGE 10410]|nr:hypothetical protein [Pleurocapsales cyanobacterium LEGE 10410]
MNKTELLKHLNNECGIQIGKDKLNKTLRYAGLQNHKTFSQEEGDVERIIEALRIIEEYGGSEEGYTKVAEQFGVTVETNLPARTRSSGSSGTSEASPTGQAPFEDDLEEMLEEEFTHSSQRIVRDFFHSEKPYQIFLNVMSEESKTMAEGMRNLRAQRMRNITAKDTVDIPAQEVRGLSEAEPSIEDADFHNQADDT